MWAARVAFASTLAILAAVYLAIAPGSPMSWTHQVLTFCLVVVGGAGRALARMRAPPAPREERPWRGHVGLLLTVIAAAVVPYLRALRAGFVSDDFVLAAAVDEVVTPGELLVSPVFSEFCFHQPVPLLA